jgi:hypothetical protein
MGCSSDGSVGDFLMAEKIIDTETKRTLCEQTGVTMNDLKNCENSDDDIEMFDEEKDNDDEDEDEVNSNCSSDEDKKRKKKKRGRKRKKKDDTSENTIDYSHYIPFELSQFNLKESNNEEDISSRKRQERSSKTIYSFEVGDNYVGDAKKWSARYYKYCNRSRCDDKTRTNVRKIMTFGKVVIITSLDENVYMYSHCGFCGSFVKIHKDLFYGDKYMCENCWEKKPEGCFYFYDHLNNNNIIIVKMTEAVKICSKMVVRSTKLSKEEEEEEEENTNRNNDDDNPKESVKNPKTKREKKKVKFINKILDPLEEEFERRKEINKTNQYDINTSKTSERKRPLSAENVSLCLKMKRHIRTFKNCFFYAIDDLCDEYDPYIIKLLSTEKKVSMSRKKIRMINGDLRFLSKVRGLNRTPTLGSESRKELTGK